MLSCSGQDTGAGDAAEGPRVDLPWAARTLPAVPEPADNRFSEEKRVLGRLLFYDPVLSADGVVACATCHSEQWGMGDGLPRAVGVEGEGPAGPGRRGPHMTRRNAPSLWNVAYKDTFFWDGRTPTLEEQPFGPIEAPEEMANDPGVIAAELATFDEYVALFEDAFPGEAVPVTAKNMMKALATFERTIVTPRAPYDSYVRGDEGALSDGALRGMWLLDEAGCASCHVPPLFRVNAFMDRGVPEVEGIEDLGRYEVTGDEADRYAFAVPSLRNARITGPYFHTGAVPDLRDAIESQVAFAVAEGESRELSDSEIDDLTQFIFEGLTDRTEEPRRPKEVPSGLPVPRDGTSIFR